MGRQVLQYATSFDQLHHSMPRITLSDLADQLGLHKSTVCRALRGDPQIGKNTRERVQALAQKLDYQRDAALATLSEMRWRKSEKRSLMNWGFLMTELAASFQENQVYMQNCKDLAHKAGFALSVIVLPPSMTTDELCRQLKARNIRGLIINQIHEESTVPKLDFERLRSACEACVYYGNFFFEPRGHRIIENTFASTQTALGRIQEQGYRQITFLYRERLISSREVTRERAAAALYREDHPEVNLSIQCITESNTLPAFPKTDAILYSQSVRLRQIPSVLRAIPYAVMRLAPDDKTTSGIKRPIRTMASAAVDLLDFQLRRQALDIESDPRTIQIESTWQRGATL
ncbi:LacI family DNA-binding transcriptional regulator [Coraliomargarita sp. SDUM461003]|uniref:LacI family DNA-binding transcriptional regulator n=1 Tax=Thalassobacterium maritimum TaxID=3041265 RepID=A0ABU1AZI2_9BACT|nr:LacI family DNA-binding transcriptional regulator [Coraliomargarita sp. SDUM461003]MDQ8208674.1 LacI family DNA-binding transcriptional regulator [Coraliomargarita sp. SDUM461003]